MGPLVASSSELQTAEHPTADANSSELRRLRSIALFDNLN